MLVIYSIPYIISIELSHRLLHYIQVKIGSYIKFLYAFGVELGIGVVYTITMYHIDFQKKKNKSQNDYLNIKYFSAITLS